MSVARLTVGCCAGSADLPALESTPGLDFIELTIAKSLMGSAGDCEQLARMIDRSSLAARAANVFLPATLKVVGPEVRPDELSAYAATALDRAHRLGVAVLVFGSGASRTVPEGFPRERAMDQLADAVRVVNEQASSPRVPLAAEPLHSTETNLLNSDVE